MFKVLLKHLIYEQCIKVFFDKIYVNFVIPDILSDLDITTEDYMKLATAMGLGGLPKKELTNVAKMLANQELYAPGVNFREIDMIKGG